MVSILLLNKIVKAKSLKQHKISLAKESFENKIQRIMIRVVSLPKVKTALTSND